MAGHGRTEDKIDRVMLHEWLWSKRDRNDFFQMSQSDLAAKLGVNIYTLSRIFGELAEQGRVEKHKSKYKIFDPAVIAWKTNGPTLFDEVDSR